MGRTSTADWRQARLPFLRGLAKPSALQRLLLDLIAHPGRTPKQDRQLESLWKAERADALADQQRQVAYRIVKDKASEKKRARDRRLIEMGALVEIAELTSDRGALLGGLLVLARSLKGAEGPALFARYKLEGDAVLKSREQARLARRRTSSNRDGTDEPDGSPSPA